MNITKLLIIVHLLPFLLVTPKNLSAETESEEQKLVRLGGYKLIYTTGTKNECVEDNKKTSLQDLAGQLLARLTIFEIKGAVVYGDQGITVYSYETTPDTIKSVEDHIQHSGCLTFQMIHEGFPVDAALTSAIETYNSELDLTLPKVTLFEDFDRKRPASEDLEILKNFISEFKKQGHLPENTRPGYRFLETQNPKVSIFIAELVTLKPGLSSRDISQSTIGQDNFTNLDYIQITMNQSGTKGLAEITRNNIQGRLAILYDDTILIAPTIQEEISGGQVHITLGHVETSKEDAQKLSGYLNSIYPVSLKQVSKEFYKKGNPR